MCWKSPGAARPAILVLLLQAVSWLPSVAAEPYPTPEAVPIGQPTRIAPQPAQPAAPGPISIEDVVAMTRAGIDPELMIQQIRDQGVDRTLTVPDLIYLKQQGVEIDVVKAMQQVASGRPVYVPTASQKPAAPAQPQTTIIYEAAPPRPAVILAPPPPVWYYRPYHYHGHHCYPHRSPSIGFGISFH